MKGSPCAVFDSNLRIQIAKKKLYSYGDATVICGKPIPSDDEIYAGIVFPPTTGAVNS